MGPTARAKIKSTLERKVKTRAKKAFFGYVSGQTIHLIQILCDTTCIIEKISPFCLVLGCEGLFPKGPK